MRGKNELMISFILLMLTVSVFGDNTTTVQTRLGNVTGISSSINVNNMMYGYSLYKNIPYAKPPTGNLRFMEPVAYGTWGDTLDGTEFGPSCIQIPASITYKYLPNRNQSEDCLSLNIYVPANSPSSNKKSVMIWIHGGGYSTGQAMLYDGSYLAAYGDVIVVTINYRLEVFGFFSTNDGVAPGNYGLWDQKLAIQWVHDNIDSFGGDSQSVTIFGQSAGGFSVALQAINPNNTGLFQRVIAQSGVSNTLLATSPMPRLTAQKLVTLLNCSVQLTAETISCLQNKAADEIQHAYATLVAQRVTTPDAYIFIDFGPVVDGKFLIDTPQNIISGKGKAFNFYKSLDVIIGDCESEGSLLVGQLALSKYNVSAGIPSKYLCEQIIPTLSTDYYQNNTRITPVICNRYTSNGSVVEQSRNAVNFYGDIFMYSPAVQSLNAHAIQNRQSHFQYLSKRLSIWSVSQKMAPWFIGAGHASELAFLFPFSPLSNATDGDRSYSIILMKYWSNFAKTGYVYVYSNIHTHQLILLLKPLLTCHTIVFLVNYTYVDLCHRFIISVLLLLAYGIFTVTRYELRSS